MKYDFDYDELNDLIARATQHIKDLGLEVTAQVPLGCEELPDVELGFGKMSGTWCLFIFELVDDVENITELGRCSRQHRVAAAPRLNDLVQALRVAQEREAREFEEALLTYHAFLED